MDYNNILQKWIEQLDHPRNLYILKNSFLRNKDLDEYNKVINYCNDNLNNSDCLYFIGFVSYFDKDYDKTIFLFKKATELNNIRAMHKLAHMYKYGIGINKSYDKAIELYSKARLHGDHEATYNLGYMYMDNQNYDKAIELYEEAINFGNVDAMYTLGYMYEHGLGIVQDYSNAISLFHKSFKKEPTLYLTEDKIKKIYLDNLDYFIKKHIKLIKKYKDIKIKIENKKNYISQLENLPFGKEYYKTLDNFNKMVNKN